MAEKMHKYTTLIESINSMEYGFRPHARHTPQCVNIMVRFHQRYKASKCRGKYYIHGIERYEDGRFNGYGSSLKNKKLIY